MMAFYFIDSVLKQSQMLADRRDPKGVMFTGLVKMVKHPLHKSPGFSRFVTEILLGLKLFIKYIL